MKRTEKKTITRTEYLELVGLMALAKRYEELLGEIERTAAKITGEDLDVAGGSLTSDKVYDDQDADRLLKSLEITVDAGF